MEEHYVLYIKFIVLGQDVVELVKTSSFLFDLHEDLLML